MSDMAIPTADVELDGLNLFDPELFAAGPPFELFARMRAESPVHRTPNPHGGHVWSLFKHEDVTAVSKDPATFSSAAKGVFLQPDQVAPLDFVRNVMLYKDPPEHNKYRSVLQPFFTPKAILRMEDAIRARVTKVIDAVIEAGRCDFAADIAVPIPLGVLTEFMGVPEADIPRFFEWTEQIERAQRSPQTCQAVGTFGEMGGYLHEQIQAQLGSGVDTLVRRLHDAEVDGESLDETELLTVFALLAFAGNDTTRNTCATGMLTLLEHPDALAALERDPELMNSAVEEILRYTSVVQYFARTALEDTEIRGRRIAKGDLVVMWYGSASRDEDLFDDPEAFDISRVRPDHKAFGGGGRHFCLGNQLARLELRVIFAEVLRRMKDIELAAEVTWLGSAWANGLVSMPVRFTPGAREG